MRFRILQVTTMRDGCGPDSELRMDQAHARTKDIGSFLDPGFLELEQVLDDIGHEVALAGGLFGRHVLELRRCPPEKRKLAITISGGGAAGAYSAGLLEVLLDRLHKRGIKVGLLVGTSSGALNGYGAFLEELGMGNPQFKSDPTVRQPYESIVASVWSYLARDGKASRWVAGHRSWIVRLMSRPSLLSWRRPWLILVFIAVIILIQPNLLLPLARIAAEAGTDFPGWIPEDSFGAAVPALFGFAVVATVLLCGAVWFSRRAFRESLFPDMPLLRLLANTGPDGDLGGISRQPRGQVIDRASVLSRDLVSQWYRRRDELPELIITCTDLTAGRGCLFTLVRPETYALLRRREWMAVQFNSESADSREYRLGNGALFALPERLLQAVVASSSVPGAFPTQCIDVYRPGTGESAHHYFVDGGVLNSSPIHIAVDAGATHVISLEIEPYGHSETLQVDERGREGYGLFEAALSTFTTVLDRATDEDIRRTASWNRFLISRPRSLEQSDDKHGSLGRGRRIVPLYRVVPNERPLGTVEFDGRVERGKKTFTLRDALRRGMQDMQGRNVWAATVRHEPGWKAPK